MERTRRPATAVFTRAREWVSRGDGRSTRRQEGQFLLGLVALAGFAITQPVLSVFGESPEWFAFRDAQPIEVVTFGLIVALAPALVLWLVALPTRWISLPVRRVVQLLTLTGLVALSAAAISGWAGVAWVALGGIAAVAYAAWAPVRTWTAYAVLAPLLVLGAFLLASPVTDLVWASGSAEVAGGVEAGPPVVVLVLDELPLLSIIDDTGTIDESRFPELAAFAEEATWYRNTTTVSGATDAAVPALLSGQEPEAEQTAMWFDHPQNLFTLLGGAYDLDVWEAPTQVCAPSLCAATTTGADAPAPVDEGLAALLGDAADVWEDTLTGAQATDRYGGFTEATGESAPAPPSTVDDPGSAPNMAEQMERSLTARSPVRLDEFLGSLAERDPERSGLHLLHLLVPHQPWVLFPTGTPYSSTPEGELLARGFVDWYPDVDPVVEVLHQRHLLQAMYADAMVGRFLDGVRESGIYDDALVVVVADHGVSFEPGGLIRTPTAENLDEMAWVPLLVKPPGQRSGSVTDIEASVLDLVPTIADLLDIEIPWPVDGTSLLEPDRPTSIERRVQRPVADGGGTLDIDPDGFAALLAAAPPPPAADLLASGGWTSPPPWRGLVGADVADLDAGTEWVGHVAIDAEDEFADVDLDGPLPAYVMGTIDVDGAAPTDVALVLDGQVAATATVIPHDDQWVFAAILPEQYFVDGMNRLEVHAIEAGDDGRAVLRPLD